MRPAVSVLAIAVAACAGPRHAPDQPPTSDDPRDAWRAFLAQRVDAEGRIALRGIRQDTTNLDVFLRWVARTDAASQPDSFPDRASQVAFHINAYIALTIRDRAAGGHNRSFTQRHEIGGRWLTLYEYEDEVIKPLGDARVYFALRSPFRSGPRLPREPFDAATLDARLDAMTRECLAERQSIEIHVSAQRLRLSPLLREFAERWCKGMPELIEFCNRHRAVPLPRVSDVEFYDDQFWPSTRWV